MHSATHVGPVEGCVVLSMVLVSSATHVVWAKACVELCRPPDFGGPLP